MTSWEEFLLNPAVVATVAAVAGVLDVDERTVRRACEDGQIPSIRVGRRLLIPRDKFVALFAVGAES
jgi:excisionase family DNA binding protein